MGAWEPNLNPGLWEVMSVNVGSLTVMNEPSPLVGDVGGGGRGDCALAGQGVCGKSLFMALNAVVSIKSCKKIAFKIFKC